MADRTRVPWVLAGKSLDRNPSDCEIRPMQNEEDRFMLNVVRKNLVSRRGGDPRAVLYWELECSWFHARRPLISLLTNLATFTRSPFSLKRITTRTEELLKSSQGWFSGERRWDCICIRERPTASITRPALAMIPALQPTRGRRPWRSSIHI